MVHRQIRSLLVVGLDALPIVSSASRAGYEAYAVDHFGDRDLKKVCVDSLSIIHDRTGRSCGRIQSDFSPERLAELAERIANRHRINGILISSGVEDSPRALSTLAELAPVLSSRFESIARVRDKTGFFSELKQLGIPHPRTARVRTFEEAEEVAEEFGYPVVVKPETGFGGAGISLARDRWQLADAIRRSSWSCLIQEYIVGTAASASLIASGKEACVLTVNEQILGERELGQREPFGWCGNTVPLTAQIENLNRASAVASKVVTHFGLIGSVGVDMVIDGNGLPWVVEVNPRFQGTMECVEVVTGLNLVEAHIGACVEKVLPEHFRVSGFCTRLIVYAPTRARVPDLGGIESVRDVPVSGVVVEEGEPVCSVISTGESGRLSWSAAMAEARKVMALLSPV